MSGLGIDSIASLIPPGRFEQVSRSKKKLEEVTVLMGNDDDADDDEAALSRTLVVARPQ